MSRLAEAEPRCTESDNTVSLIIDGRPRDLGGFEVRRILPNSKRRLVGPFIFFDEMGPARLEAGKGVDVRPHPHIGLATVTWLFDGELVHRDSLEHHQTIRPGAVNWMTAGRGIVHSERTGPGERARVSHLHGIQSWVALPLEHEETDPWFRHYPADSLPVIEQDGVRMCLIAGEAYGQRSPVEVFSRTFYLDAKLEKGSRLELPPYEERAVYVVQGAITVDGETIEPHRMAVLAAGAEVAVIADEASRVMLLGGESIKGERHIWWNFVASSETRIEQAKVDWAEGRFAKVPGETEFIPLPED